MQAMPAISLGHFIYVSLWALLGMCIGAVAWADGRKPTYKDYLAGTIGISFEALGVEIADRHPSMIVPLAVSLSVALLIRYLPMPERRWQLRRKTHSPVRVIWPAVLVLGFFWTQVGVLLLSYRGWWTLLVLYPEV
jgi:hypothetical protein